MRCSDRLLKLSRSGLPERSSRSLPSRRVAKGAAKSDVVDTKPDEIWTPENIVIPDRILSESEEDEIRTSAYSKWEAAGKPNGHQGRFWLEAEEELLAGS